MKRMSLVFFILLISGSIFALEVDVDEIKKAKKVKFVNYKGRYKTRTSVREIKAIGRILARKTRRANKRYRYRMKYSIIHAVSKKQPKKLSGDIFIIDRNAKVGHIKNVRRIISGYLESRYKYSTRHAKVLSFFITYYNAVYRGDLKYFSKLYKSVVMRNLNRKNAGISTKYYNWPGKTRIVIPLTKDFKRGKIDTIDPDIISDKKVIKVIRKDERHIKKRKTSFS
ncbi:P83/100 family protein [Spirochaetota bacterium]